MDQSEAGNPQKKEKENPGIPGNRVVKVILVCVLALVLAFFIIYLLTPEEVYMPARYVQPAAGTILAGQKQVSDSEFRWETTPQVRILNTGLSEDVIAVFTATGSKQPLVAYYIPKGSVHYAPLQAGDYDLYLYTGRDLNPATKKFGRNPAYNRWNTTISFPAMRNGEAYISQEISLSTGAGVPVTGALPILETDAPALSG